MAACWQVDKHAEKRLSYLTDIFNAIPDGDVRFRVLLDAIEYAKKSGLAGSLAPVIKVSLLPVTGDCILLLLCQYMLCRAQSS